MRMLMVAVLLLWSCTSAQRSSISSGSVAQSMDGALVYAADTDNGLLLVFDAKSLALLASVRVGASPFRVEVGADDTVYVANRGSRSISVVRRGEWTVAAELATGIDPAGMRVNDDGSILYVVSTVAPRQDYGTLTAIDTRTLAQLWELPLGDEPRGIALTAPNRALITLMRESALVVVDLDKHELVDRVALELQTGIGNQPVLRLTALTDVAASVNDIVLVGRSATTTFVPTGPFGWGASSSVTVSVTKTGAPTGFVGQGAGATVGVIAQHGPDLLQAVVNREASTVSFTSAGAVPAVPVGQGADGISVTEGRTTAFVYAQFDHELARLEYDYWSNTWETAARGRGASDVLPPGVVAGRKLFHSAQVSVGSAACSSCHVEGRDDGHVWQLGDGPRQTPTLAGRSVTKTAPFHWAAEFTELSGFYDHTVKNLMGGKGLTADEQQAVTEFIEWLPAPENPYASGELTAQEHRGRLAFQKAECGTCHGGAFLSMGNRADVGTAADGDSASVLTSGLDTPSLRGLARSAPYLHDGSARTLTERFSRQRGDQHGKISVLADGELDDLIAYLRTL